MPGVSRGGLASCRGGHADNNAAERGLRPMVIARKVSFGSQSERGLKRRRRIPAGDRILSPSSEGPANPTPIS